MCGIVGAVAQQNIVPVLLQGLQRLEYRGYDSCGIAIYNPQHNEALTRVRSVDRVAQLETAVKAQQLAATIGIAHTRWATHGAPVTNNAHPHFSQNRIALVHNGIIENYEELRTELQGQGFIFESQTDTEVIAHLIHHLFAQENDLFKAVQLAVKRLHGAYAIAVFCKDQADRIVGARLGSPLVLGLTAQGHYLASDAIALSGVTDQILYLEEGDVVELSLQKYQIVDQQQKPVTRKIYTVQTEPQTLALGPYQHFMQKEIFEQPRAIADTLEGVSAITADLFGANAEAIFKQIEGIQIIACGTSYYAGLVAKYWLEAIAKIPTQVEIASEYRYRNPVLSNKTLVVSISQSGETADTLAALRFAQQLANPPTLAICNVATASMVREAQLHYITRAGVEIGVASTKAFTTQLATLFLLTLSLAKLRGHLSEQEEHIHLKNLRHLPLALQSVLALEPQIIAWAENFAKREHALFLGRGLHYPIALEGALKLKELSYIHAEAYPAGELKHGPLALVTEHMPVITIAPNDTLLEKLKSNIQEVRARGGQMFVFADADSNITKQESIHLIRLPEHYGMLSPILHVVPLQLLSYHTALIRGTDVDKPRNLAKSVTVE